MYSSIEVRDAGNVFNYCMQPIIIMKTDPTLTSCIVLYDNFEKILIIHNDQISSFKAQK